MTDAGADLRAQVALLRQDFVRSLPQRMALIDELWAAWCGAPGRMDKEAADALHRVVHSLTGAGATFGFPAISDGARELERLLRALLASPTDVPAAMRVQVDTALSALRSLATNAAAPALLDASAPELPDSAIVSRAGNHRVLSVEDDVQTAQELAAQLAHFGYSVRTVGRAEDLPDAMRDFDPMALVMDVVLPGMDGIEAVRLLNETTGRTAPAVFVSSHGDFDMRLRAVRVGALAYLTKPVDIVALIDILDALSGVRQREAYRVLLVDDTETVAEYYASILSGAGMTVRCVIDPRAVPEALADFSPDLILIDYHMPGCSGPELAAVLRQQDSYASVPIVFLSSESDVEAELGVMGIGADDYLMKTISPRQLVATVAARADRARQLRGMMLHDGLTDLLNHAAVKERLEVELVRSRRNRSPLVVAMLDIDRFKSVNDRYGHPVGDRVIRALARLLVQRLRKSDIIGRYGGEEYLVILPDTSAAAAREVLNALRRDFASVQHAAATETFQTTFSAGIAELAGHDSVATLINAADGALYSAKRGGRNRVEVADRPSSAASAPASR